MRRALFGLGAVALVLLLAQPAWAQQAGTLGGTVTDPDGAPLPGVSVTLSGPAMMGTKTVTTGQNGTFRFPGLIPGDYAVLLELSGFSSVSREGIRVSVGQTTSVDVTLQLASVEETITVTGESPVVDIKSSSVAVTYDKDLIENVPTSRNWADIVYQVPGITIGFYTERFNFSSHGGSVRDNEVSIDGVANTDPVVGYASSQLAYESMEEIQIVTGSHQAEYGSVSGAYVNIVTKSGGNEFHGEGNFYYENEDLQSDNLTPELEDQGIGSPPKITKFRDFSGNLGGPIAKDRLWFYTSVRKWDVANVLDGFPVEAPGTIDAEVLKHYGFVKGTFQVGSNHKLVGIYNRNGDSTPFRNASRFRTKEATFDSDEHTNVYKAQWTAVFGDDTYMEANWARSARHWCLCEQEGATNTYFDLATGIVSGGNFLYRINDRIRNQANVRVSHFEDDLAGGSHDLKMGVEWERSPFDWQISTLNNVISHYLIGGTPIFAHVTNTPNTTKEVNRALHFFAQDSWNIGGQVTLNLGLRVNHWEGGYPPQSFPGNEFFGPITVDEEVEALNWTSFDPRFGLVWDVGGDGRTAFRLGLNRYHQKLISQYYDISNPNSLSGTFHFWTDTNGDLQAQPGELSSPLAQWGGVGGSVDPDLKHPYTDEFTVGIEHELFTDFSVGANFIYKEDNDLIEDINLGVPDSSYEPVQIVDPGPDGVVGTGDDQNVTVFNQVANFGEDQFHITNPEEAYRDYKGFELIFTKRMSNRWQLLGSVVYNKAEGNVGNNYGSATGRSSAFDSPNTMINRGGVLPLDQTWQLKASGTWQAPWGVNLSTYYRYLSGYPIYRTHRIRLNQGNVTYFADPWGKWREDGYHMFDVRAEKVFDLGSAARLGVMIDAFNLFNDNTVTNRESRSRFGTFNDPLSILPPRILRFGIRLMF